MACRGRMASLLLCSVVFLPLVDLSNVDDSTFQSNATIGKQTGSILQVLLESQYSEMVEMIEKASMLHSLEQLVGSGAKLTFFVPMNNELYPKLKTFLLKPSNAKLLKQTVEFHVASSRVTASGWSNSTLTSLSSEPLSLTSHQKGSNVRLLVQETLVVAPDVIVREDGVVHGVDGMLLPNSVQAAFVAWSTKNVHSPLVTGAPGLDSRAAAMFSSLSVFTSLTPFAAPSPFGAPTPFSAPAPGPSLGPSLQPFPGGGDEEVQTFVSSMVRFGGYNEFAELLVSLTSLGTELSKLVSEGYKFTILAPHDAAVKELTSEQLNSQATLEIILHYHILTEYQTEDSLYSTVRRVGKATYSTLRYPFSLTAQEADGTVQFGEGLHSAFVYDHDIFADGRVSVQGINKVLIPPDLVPKSNSMTSHTRRSLISESSETSQSSETEGVSVSLHRLGAWFQEHFFPPY